MARWAEDARGRLAASALELFAERGFAATTVDEVAAAAGVTQRTFFRHFRDKEEVLFADDDRLLQVLLDGVGRAEGEDAEADLGHALAVVSAELEPRREQLRRRAGVIATDVALTGRELAKQAGWTAAVAQVLQERGYPGTQADLMAQVGFAVFRNAMDRWLSQSDGPPLAAHVEQCRADVGAAFRSR